MSLHRHGDRLLIVDAGTFEHRDATYTSAWISAGRPTFERLSFDGEELYRSPVRVEVTVSPTGRSVQIHINGQRVAIPGPIPESESA